MIFSILPFTFLKNIIIPNNSSITIDFIFFNKIKKLLKIKISQFISLDKSCEKLNYSAMPQEKEVL